MILFLYVSRASKRENISFKHCNKDLRKNLRMELVRDFVSAGVNKTRLDLEQKK